MKLEFRFRILSIFCSFLSPVFSLFVSMWLFSLTASAAVNSASAPASAPTSVPIEPTQISVVDQNNNPLANAVIEYTSPPSVEQDSNSNQGADSNKDTTYIMDQIDKQFVPYVLIVPQNNLVSFPNSV